MDVAIHFFVILQKDHPELWVFVIILTPVHVVQTMSMLNMNCSYR